MTANTTHCRRKGFTIVEMLIALAITGVLLGAISLATKAATDAYRTNDVQSQLATKARNVMQRMVNQIRRSSLHKPHTTDANNTDLKAYVNSGTPMTDIGITLIDSQPNGSSVSYVQYDYWYDTSDANNGKISVTIQPGTMDFSSGTPKFTAAGSATTSVLINSVTAFSITLSPIKSNANAPTYDTLFRASIIFQLRDSDTSRPASARPTISLCSSATPRQVVWTGSKLAAPLSKLVTGYTVSQ